MTLIGATFCSGIGTPELACDRVEWRFASEIESFPRAVLMHRFGMQPVESGYVVGLHALWGDMTALRVRHLRKLGIPLPNLIVAGTPCQAFSIAGLRKGTKDDRGNLTLEFVRTVHAFRNAGSLRALLWENVPGVLSDRTNAFGSFLAGLVGADDALQPPRRNKWPNAGMVSGPHGRAAWTILDAQHFGLAQRRKRVFVVFSVGESGIDPATVLFEWGRGDGYSPKSGEARKAVAGTISSRTSAGGGLGTDFELNGGLTAVETDAGQPASVAPTLNASFGEKLGLENQHALGGAGLFVPAAFGGGNTSDEPRGVSAALTAKGQRLDFEVETFIVSGHGDYRRGDAPSLRASGGDVQGGSEALVKMAFAIQERAVSENVDTGPQGKGFQEELAYTLEARNKVQAVDHSLLDEQRVVHALRGEGFDASEDGTGRGTPIIPVPPVVYSIMPQNSGKNYKARQVEPSQPVMAGGPVGGNQGGDYVVTAPIAFSMRGRDGGALPEVEDGSVAPVVRTPAGGSSQTFIAFSSKDYGSDASEDISPTLRAGAHDKSHANAGAPPAIAFNARQDTISSVEVTQPLDTDGGTVGNADSDWRVRRLTVVEAEILQGLPPNHTLVPWKSPMKRDPQDYEETVRYLISHGYGEAEARDLAHVPDGPRYKACGNGMARNVISWILNRIVDEYEKAA